MARSSDGIALISAILGAPEPKKAAEDLLSLLPPIEPHED